MEPPRNSNSPHWELSGEIIHSAQWVLSSLKPGLDEKLYENALVIALQKKGMSVEQQREFPVFFEGEKIGKLIPDLIVEGKVIVDPKVVARFSDVHVAQMMGYLAITGLNLALLINFKYLQPKIKRVVRT